MKKSLVIFLGVLACLGALSVPASAEWFADLFVGPSFTQNDDLVLKGTSIGTIRAKDVSFKNTVIFGGRAGYWLESTPYLGLGMDVSHFRPDIKKGTQTICNVFFGGCIPGGLQLAPIDIWVTGISFDAMLRWPLLVSKDFPKGQLQPYLTVGPTIFIARAKDSTNFIPGGDADTDTSVGVKAGAGLAWQFHRNVALFGEYRFTHFSPDFSLRDTFLGRFTANTDLNTHRAVFGISFRLQTP